MVRKALDLPHCIDEVMGAGCGEDGATALRILEAITCYDAGARLAGLRLKVPLRQDGCHRMAICSVPLLCTRGASAARVGS